jgi:hypothetical protein
MVIQLRRKNIHALILNRMDLSSRSLDSFEALFDQLGCSDYHREACEVERSWRQ